MPLPSLPILRLEAPRHLPYGSAFQLAPADAPSLKLSIAPMMLRRGNVCTLSCLSLSQLVPTAVHSLTPSPISLTSHLVVIYPLSCGLMLQLVPTAELVRTL